MVTSQFYTLEFIYAVLKKTLENNEGTIKMDNPEKLAA
jgi:hypothetical protein